MKYPTVRVVFDRKKQATKQKTGLVQIEIQYNQKRKFISTGVKVYAGQWKDKTMVTGRLDAIELNEMIILVITQIREYINGLIKKKRIFIREVRRIFDAQKKGRFFFHRFHGRENKRASDER